MITTRELPRLYQLGTLNTYPAYGYQLPLLGPFRASKVGGSTPIAESNPISAIPVTLAKHTHSE